MFVFGFETKLQNYGLELYKSRYEGFSSFLLRSVGFLTVKTSLNKHKIDARKLDLKMIEQLKRDKSNQVRSARNVRTKAKQITSNSTKYKNGEKKKSRRNLKPQNTIQNINKEKSTRKMVNNLASKQQSTSISQSKTNLSSETSSMILTSHSTRQNIFSSSSSLIKIEKKDSLWKRLKMQFQGLLSY